MAAASYTWRAGHSPWTRGQYSSSDTFFGYLALSAAFDFRLFAMTGNFKYLSGLVGARREIPINLRLVRICVPWFERRLPQGK